MNNENIETLDYRENKPEKIEIIGVRFRDTGKVYYFAPGELKVQENDRVIVETARGMEYGFVSTPNQLVSSAKIVPPLRPVIRIATDRDTERYEANKKLEAEAFEICRQKIADHGLDMKLIEAEYTFDNSKLLFYFYAEVRVDFRDLVKDLASVFRTRIELRQIQIRDQAKLIGGLGVCGRPLCCSSFLSDFVQVSIKMAKEQNLSLNSSKISGTCGRLMCCLRYEHETYEEEIARTPPVDSTVKTADGVGTVTEISPLAGTIKVKLGDGSIKSYHRDNVTVLKKNRREYDKASN
ncbi:MAG: stage 0 sporulation family protein [Clostridia bacterium]|nr:stage 0 sporulation family protein [Clostridia bacterium]